MAMITCPECGRQISEYAPACIGCGIPMEMIKKLLAQTDFTTESVQAETKKTRDIRCIICGTRYDIAEQNCPVCTYPAFSLSSTFDNNAIASLGAQFNGTAVSLDLSQPLLTRAYTYSDLDKLGETVSHYWMRKLVSAYGKFVEQGNIYARANLGMLYFREYGTNFDQDVAIELLSEPAKQGITEAQFIYGWILADIDGRESEGAEWIRKAAEKGHQAAQCKLGVLYENGQGIEQDKTKAAEWYDMSAEQGYADAQYKLGVCYRLGKGVEKNSAQAAEWYRKAAEQGHAEAQYYLGYLYGAGRGVKKDYIQALAWYLKAAKQGHAGAQNNLGSLYQNGQGAKQNYKQAAEWYRKAADQGSASAQYNLGTLYEYGRGVKKDYSKALEFYRKAAEQGDADAAKKLTKLKK